VRKHFFQNLERNDDCFSRSSGCEYNCSSCHPFKGIRLPSLEEIGSLVELVSRIRVPFFQRSVQHLVSKGCRVIVFDVKNLVVELWQFEVVVLSNAK
jgi:hypothetical protein